MRSRDKILARKAKAMARSSALIPERLDHAFHEIEQLAGFRSTLAQDAGLDTSEREETNLFPWGVQEGISQK